MKRCWWFLLIAPVATTFLAAEAPPPDLSLRVNGHAGAEAPLILWRGEPMLAAVELRRTRAPGAAEPLVLDPPSGDWFTRVTITGTGSPTSEAWPLVPVGKPSTGALVLQPQAITTLVLRLDPAAAARLAVGTYQLVARLNLTDGRGWRGALESDTVAVEVRELPATLTGAQLGQRQLGRVRDALLVGDLPRAKIATAEIVSAEFTRPEGFVATALVFAAEGKRRLALLSIDRAIALASGVTEKEGAVAAGGEVRKPIPFEYYDLRRRFEQMPSNEPEREPPIERSASATQVVFAAPASVPVSSSPPQVQNHATVPTEAARVETRATIPAAVSSQAQLPQHAVVAPAILPDRTAAQQQPTMNVTSVPVLPTAIEKVTNSAPTGSLSSSTIPRLMNVQPADQGARDPKDFPRPARSIRKSYSSVWQKTRAQDSAIYSSTDTLDGITEFYIQNLRAEGWAILTKIENNQAVGNKRQTVLNWKKATRTVIITLVETNPTGTEISVNLTTQPTP
ncbi:MAG: hypothetical protein ABIZ04_13475 [Opitutus sp.]